ncbi:MAG: DNA repair protein RecO [Anaerococcus sp.]|nr:DNA repair protein RecO [Anaerococcus sp.]
MATNDLNDIDGFILREFKYKETSKILEIFAKDLGRISILARGVFKKNSSLLGLTNRFSKVNLSLYKSGKDFYGIREGSLISSYKKSSRNFDIMVYKSAICDLLLKTIDDTQVGEVYMLLDRTFEAFEKSDSNYINIFLSFLIKYVSFSGLKPNFSTCGRCGKVIRDGRAYFSISEASLVCEDETIRDKIYLDRNELTYFLRLLYTSSDELYKIKLAKDYQKVGRLIIDYCLNKLDLRNFSSMDWVYKNLSERNINVL